MLWLYHHKKYFGSLSYFVGRMSKTGLTSSKKSTKRKSENTEKAITVKKLKTDSDDSKSAEKTDFIDAINKSRLSAYKSVAEFKFNKKRVRVISKSEDIPDGSNGVVYWMSRDQRVQDNWAFLYAQRLALKIEAPLYVCFCLVPKFLDSTIRHFGFMLKGLAEVEKECRDLNIPFHLLMGEAKTVLPEFVRSQNIGGVVTDFSPLRVPLQWVKDVKDKLPPDITLCQVDAHNIIPCWEASPKLEYAARTIRNKIHKQMPEFHTEYPPLVTHPHSPDKMPPVTGWEKAESFLEVNRDVKEVSWAKPGTEAGLKVLESFIDKRLKDFNTLRNDPNRQALSNLSPWLHFGQISAQRCILMTKPHRNRFPESVDAFVEEAVIRRELADNFCFYNKLYDSVKGTNDWAIKTLKDHGKDKRPHLYTREQLEQGKTCDPLWNAAQIQMVNEGKMHGFLRMYWAKKILEWTKSPEEALADAIYLNDKYSLDGRDPNGYVGCMWSICGIHDQGWREREVFGKIRYMNYAGCKRKFDVAKFEAKYKAKNV